MIHLLPGMGADHRMYAASAWQTLPDSRALDWPEHRGETTIAAIATRVIAAAGIRAGDTIIGSSLGGMVGCEIANQLPLRALVLIGSAQAPSEISPLLALLHPLTAVTPLELIRAAAGKLPGELPAMFAGSDAKFIRTMCRAIFQWPGLRATRRHPLRIHGRHDLVIPPPQHVDLLLDGGHLIAMTHAEQCVGYLLRRAPWETHAT